MSKLFTKHIRSEVGVAIIGLGAIVAGWIMVSALVAILNL